MRDMKWLGRFVLSLVLAAATVFVFDVLAYFLAPASLTAFASSYRRTDLLSGPVGSPLLARAYPRHYYRADPALGFDLNPGARAMHAFGEVANEIFANSLGCFDRNELATLKAAPEYHYFAGDSFTWGYADYESKFATVWESLTKKAAAKCGVSHTGTAAQFEKFKRVAQAVGRFPATVFVGFYVNDPANDAAFPHTTVIDGYMVDTVYLRGDSLVRPDPAELERVVTGSIRELLREPGVVDRVKTAIWVFSLSANMADRALRLAREARAERGTAGANAGGQAGATAPAPVPTSMFGASLYYWYDTAAMEARYRDDPKVAANKAAVQLWARHARENGYRLVILLFPPKQRHDSIAFFGQVREFLDQQGVEYLDLAGLFREAGLRVGDLYWETNGHWSAEGNRHVGRLLAKRYP